MMHRHSYLSRLSALPVLAMFLSFFYGAPAKADLVQYWPFDEGATNPTSLTAANSVAGGNPGVLTNFVTVDQLDLHDGWITTGLPPGLSHSTGALDFDWKFKDADKSSSGVPPATFVQSWVNGGDIGMNIPIGSTDPNDQVTVSMWINLRERREPGMRIFSQASNGVNATDGGGVAITGAPTRNLLMGSGADNGGFTAFPGDDENLVILDVEQWLHLAFVWEQDNVTLYVDGTNEGTVAGTPFSYDGLNDGGDNSLVKVFGIGSPFEAEDGQRFGNGFNGLMDDVAIWDQSLTAAEVSLLFGGASPESIVAPATADFDGDGDVDGADFLKWQRDLGDATNLALWETEFGTTAVVAAVAVVPEPASWILVCTIALAATRRRRWS